MGNLCCFKSSSSSSVRQTAEQTQQLIPLESVVQTIETEHVLQGIRVIVKAGDILKEPADAIVSGTDNFVQKRSNAFSMPTLVNSLNQEVVSKRGKQLSEQPLQNGQVIVTGPCGLKNVSSVLHVVVPLWRGGKHRELAVLEQAFTTVLNEAAKSGVKSIIITDIASSLFGVPKQLNAAALVSAVISHSEQKQKVEVIKFVHKEIHTVKIFEEYFIREANTTSRRRSEQEENAGAGVDKVGEDTFKKKSLERETILSNQLNQPFH